MIKYEVIKIKDLRKAIWLLFIGLLTAVVIYPFLHELGHTLAAIIFKNRVCNFRLFPLPSVTCEMDSTDKFAFSVVGFGGMFFPYLLSVVFPKKHFWLWYLWVVISGICLLSFMISIVGIVRYKLGTPIANEDITQIMTRSEEYYVLFLVILIFLSAIRIAQIIHSAPIRRCLKEFNI